jgi:hypothetical protein
VTRTRRTATPKPPWAVTLAPGERGRTSVACTCGFDAVFSTVGSAISTTLRHIDQHRKPPGDTAEGLLDPSV